jgi:hypothetical protein
MLHIEYRGLFIPPLPQKSLIDHKIASEEFLRLRRANLQVRHPTISWDCVIVT